MFVIAGFSFKYGNMDRLRYGSDSFGNLCGTKNSGFDGAIDATGLPNLHYVTPWIKDGPKLCVAACTPKYEQADMSSILSVRTDILLVLPATPTLCPS